MSSPSNSINRPKANLTVASLMNCTSVPKNPLSNTDKILKHEQNLLVNSTSKVNDSGNLPSNRGLPTVTDSTLLYKSVPSPEDKSVPPPLAPTSPVTATITVNYTLKPYTNIIGTFGVSNHESGLSAIKVPDNLVTPVVVAPVSRVDSTATYIDIKPAPSISDKIPKVSSSSLVNLLNATKTNISTVTTTTSTVHNIFSVSSNTTTQQVQQAALVSTAIGNLLTNHIASSNASSILKKKILNTAKPHNGSAQTSNGKALPPVFVPRGWNRIVEKDYITYISPNKSRLRSMEDLVEYLQLEGTCKCGLECPFKPAEVFNFNPSVPSKFGFSASGKVEPDRVISCNVCRKFEEMFPPASKSKQTLRGRRSGVKNKRNSSSDEAKPSPERKKILLTGASPLEMFQTKMDVINASSSQFLKNFAKTPTGKLSAPQPNHTYAPSSVTELTMTTVSDPSHNTFSISQSPTETTSTVDSAPGTSVSASYPQSIVASLTADNNPNHALTIGGNATTPVMTKSTLLGTEQHQNKITKTTSSSRGRGCTRGARGSSHVDFTISSRKSTIKKTPSPNLQQTNSSAQLQEILNQISQKDAVATKYALINQLHNLMATTSKTPEELNEISKAFSSLQTLQILTSPASTSALQQTSSLNALATSPPPPNRTISSADQLPEGLKHQCTTSLVSSTSSNHTTAEMLANHQKVLALNEYNTISRLTSSVNNQQLSTSLHTLPLSKQSQLQGSTVVNTLPGSQQMLLLQLVSQANTKPTTANAPVVCAISVAPQTYVQQPKLVIMDNKKTTNNISTIQALEVQQSAPLEVFKSSLEHTTHNNIAITTNNKNISNNTRTVQIKSPASVPYNALPVQYVTTVNPTSLKNSFPVVQYIPQPQTAYVYPSVQKNTFVRPGLQAVPTSFVRIAPAVNPPKPSTCMSPLEQEKQKQEHELLLSMQEHLGDKKISVYDSLPGAREFLSDVAKKISPTTESPQPSTATSLESSSSLFNSSPNLSSTPSLINSRIADNSETSLSSLPLQESKVSLSSGVIVDSVSQADENCESTSSSNTLPSELCDEFSLQCNESSTALMPDNDEISMSHNQTTHLKSSLSSSELSNSNRDHGYKTGDVVWIQLFDSPTWPGIVVSPENQPELSHGHAYVEMLYTKQLHKVTFSQLESFQATSEMVELSQSSAETKDRSDLEKAIIEAVQRSS